jgi:hypothetical protein
LATLLFLRLFGLSLLHSVVSVLIYCLELVFSITARMAAQVRSFARSVIKFAYVLARWLARLIWIGLFWSRLKVRAFTLSLVNVASLSFSTIRREGYARAFAAAKLLSLGLSGGRVKAHASAVALLNLAAISYFWIVAKTRDRAPFLSELVSAIIPQVREYRRRGLASAGRLALRGRVSVQRWQRSQEATRLKLTRLHLRPLTSIHGSLVEEESGLTSKPAPLLYLRQLPTSSRQVRRAMADPMAGRALKGASSWGYLALWMFVAGCSSYYLLFTRSTDPIALESQTFSPSAPNIQGTARLTTGQVAGPMKSSKQRHQELSEIQASFSELSRQIARLDTRLKPIEELVAVAKSGRPREQKFSDSQAEQSMAEKKPIESSWGGPAPPLPGPLRPEERMPETVAEDAAETGAREDFTFCRKWVGLGTIVCRRENGTALVVGPADRSALANGGVSAEPPSGTDAIGDAEATVPAPAAEIPKERAGEIASDKIRYGIELGRAHQPGELMQLWRQFLTSHVALAAGLEPRRVLTRAEGWRLIAGPFDTIGEARAACALLNRASKPCKVSLYAGDPLGLTPPRWTGVSN